MVHNIKMAAPQKPWERGAGQYNHSSFSSVGDFGRGPVNQHSSSSGLALSGSSGSGPAVSRAPPPLPSRPSQQSSGFGSPLNRYGGFGYSSGYGGFGNNFGSYGGMYGGSGLYGGGLYGGGGMFGGGGYYGQGQFGRGGDPGAFNQFLRQAEENSRPAFQSIESIVQAFGSISMMMESTLQTVYNSFRAVLGVADHFSRLKVHLAHIFTALALFRTLRYLYRRLLVFLGLRSREFAEELWKEAQGAGTGELEKVNGQKKPGAPSWPIFMFFAVVVGGPYIIWKLLSSAENDSQDQPAWASGEDDHVVARAEFDFDAEGSNELSFKAGAMMNLAPKEMQPKVRGWVLASVDGQSTGLVPANYIKILGKRRGRQIRAGPEGQNEESKAQSETPSEQAVAMGSGLQGSSTRASSALPASHSEFNLAAFDEAFVEAPASHATGPALPAGLDGEWSAWEKEQTEVGPSAPSDGMEAAEKLSG
ncbi:peroxisomal membrane protein PEX13-like [Acanthaster planci]|uniref:Peroxisomal membrane protein PEX13 n=1 Tax=Acanthaster planci TaxID=133434 RepID=A0A8B7YFM9_ACAPL|nr:peroxisomal membrane protein PEX13-like [Acanthaster planci]